MTKKQFDAKLNWFVKDSAAFLKAFGQQALKSGAVDLKSAPNDYVLPKDVLVAGLLRLANASGHGPMPHQKASKKRIANIRLCTPLTVNYAIPKKSKNAIL